MRRRTVLAAGTAAIVSLGQGKGNALPGPIDPSLGVPTTGSGSGPLSVVIEYQGNTFQYSEAFGTDLGDYHDPANRFVQQCVRATNPQFPITVFFRPDRATDRAEVVFELGNPWSHDPPQNLLGYRAIILRSGLPVATISVPQHFWYSRWRWQSTPRPMVTTTSQLIMTGLLPHYDARVLGRYAKDNPAPPYSPMTLAGITPNMGQTSERPDIGPVTGWQADYICAGTNLPAVLGQAEASGTLNIHVRDPNTGAPIDLMFTYPKAGTYSASTNSPFISSIATTIDGRPLQYDTGHNPSLAYLPFLLTGDPYYLEELQFPAGSHFSAIGRYLAWPLRDKFHAAAMTPESVPTWLLPQSYFRAVVDGQRLQIAKYLADTSDPNHYVFKLITSGGSQGSPGLPAGSYFDPWQEDFIAFVIGWGVQMGFVEWTDALNWKIDCTVQRTNGTSGWPRAQPTPYQVTFEPGCALAAAVGVTDTTIQVDVPQGFLGTDFVVTVDSERMLVIGGERTNVWTVSRGYEGTRPAAHAKGHGVIGEKFTSWKDCAASNAKINPTLTEFMPGDPTGMNELYTIGGGTVTYPSYSRGALAMAARLGVQSAVAPFAWIDQQMTAAISPQYYPDRKWMVT